jgi:predicted kinase
MQHNNQKPILLVFFGLIASGKSTLAQMWAEAHGAAYFNSDRVRKELAGLDPTCSRKESFSKGIYSREFTERTYNGLLDLAEGELKKCNSVALDASYGSLRQRTKVVELAGRSQCRLYFILCTCSEEIVKKRLAQRDLDPDAVSDGRWDIYIRQKEKFELPDELSDRQLVILNTAAPIDKLLGLLEYQLEY